MIIDSFDNSKPITTIEDFYGERKKIVNKCLITFSRIIFDYILENYDCEIIAHIKSANGISDIFKTNFNGEEIAFYLTPIGACMAGTYLIEVSHLTGATKFLVFGSAGSLDADKTRNKYVIASHAYRDEGMSYHYAPPQDYIEIKNYLKIEEIFKELNLPYVIGKVWTTDAFYRETINQYKKRKEEGCIAVEMELSGLQAICDFHNYELYNFLETGDVLNEDDYTHEGLHNANHNFDKFEIALEILKRI